MQFIGSTEVLKVRSRHYEKLFAALDEYPGILDRIAVEEKAVDQIQAGTYGTKILTQKMGMFGVKSSED